MGAITDRVNEFWSPLDLARAIDTELEVLRRDIQNLKGKEPTFEEKMMKIVIDTKAQLAKDKAQVFRGHVPEPPKAPLPPEQWERGDFISYKRAGENKKVWGVFHHLHNDSDCLWAYWQKRNGDFIDHLNFMPKDEVTFEFRPEK